MSDLGKSARTSKKLVSEKMEILREGVEKGEVGEARALKDEIKVKETAWKKTESDWIVC